MLVKPWLVVLALTGCNQAFGLDDTDLGYPCWDTGSGTSHDEDGDGVADGCDICPGTANAQQVDEDFDGVGDECDPHADSADRIAFFDAFAEAQLPTEWQPYGARASWLLVDGAVVGDSTSATVDAVGTLILDRVFSNAIVEVLMTGQNHVDTTKFTLAGVYTRIEPGTEATFPPGLLCSSYFAPDSASGYPRRAVVSEPQPSQMPKADESIKFGDPSLFRSDSTGRCIARIGANPAVTAAIELAPVAGKIGLHTHHTTVRFESITVFEPAP